MRIRLDRRLCMLVALFTELSTGCASPAQIEAAEIILDECETEHGISSPECDVYLSKLSRLRENSEYWSELGRDILENQETDGAPEDRD